jgi:hypothetical protein
MKKLERTSKANSLLMMGKLALKAMEEAVDRIVEEHRQKGLPIVVWRDGRVQWIFVDPPVPAKRKRPRKSPSKASRL